MSHDIRDIPWGGVTDDGHARAELAIPPYDRVDVHPLKLSFYYTGDTPGRLQVFRDLANPRNGTWILHTDATGQLSAADDARWTIQPIPQPAP